MKETKDLMKNDDIVEILNKHNVRVLINDDSYCCVLPEGFGWGETGFCLCKRDQPLELAFLIWLSENVRECTEYYASLASAESIQEEIEEDDCENDPTEKDELVIDRIHGYLVEIEVLIGKYKPIYDDLMEIHNRYYPEDMDEDKSEDEE